MALPGSEKKRFGRLGTWLEGPVRNTGEGNDRAVMDFTFSLKDNILKFEYSIKTCVIYIIIWQLTIVE